jgi:tRNA (pseudouridine54-N1)-methyltransferase
MREFVYFSQSARTSGNFNTNELMKAGRMDIAIHVIIASFFLSHNVREDVKLHLVFYGQPTPPRHIEIILSKKKGVPETGKEVESLDISKKDIAGLIKRILYKYREGRKTEVFDGCFVEKKSFWDVIEQLREQGKEIFLLDKKGEDIRKVKIGKNCVFVLGDHKGLPKKELKRLKAIAKPVSLGNRTYFASHVVSVVNNELDRRGI